MPEYFYLIGRTNLLADFFLLCVVLLKCHKSFLFVE